MRIQLNRLVIRRGQCAIGSEQTPEQREDDHAEQEREQPDASGGA